MGTRRADSNVGCQPNLPYLAWPCLYLPVFTPRFFTRSLTTRIPKHNIPHPRPDPAFPSHPFIGQGARRAWMDHRGASPSAAQGLGMGNSNSNAANAQRLGTGLRDGGSQPAAPLAGFIGCRIPSMRSKIHPRARYSCANFVS